MNKKTIMVDMDEVITENGFLYLLNKYLKTNYKATDINHFRMQNIMPYAQRLEFFKWFKNYNMYDYCNLVSGAKENLKILSEYYSLFVGTSYIFPEVPEMSGKILKEKFDFLYNNLPFISHENLIFINQKNLLQVYCKIDDSIKNLVNAEKLFLFPAYHNQNLREEELISVGIEKVDGWNDITRKLLP